jgi:hypothetical protein
MGNICGLSTSGIPISATVISIIPDPTKESCHGGVFGAEGGVVAPAAYVLGMLLLVLGYGMPNEETLEALIASPLANVSAT